MDYSILNMLQRLMRQSISKRKPIPRNESLLKKYLEKKRLSLMECLGTRPDKIVSPEVQKEAELTLGDSGVIQERIIYRTEEDVWVPAHIYKPEKSKGKKLPGVLLLQGWDLDKHTMSEFKIRLAAVGYVVLFPDNRFSGERRRASDGMAEQANLLPVAGLFGLTFMGMNTWDNQRALDILAARPDVYDEKLGVTGLCWGGMQTWTLAAIDKRVKAACPVCSVSTYEALLQDFIPWTGGHSCYGAYLWNWASYGDIQDIIACIAPRPLLIQNNVNDTWFPISGYDRVVREVSEVYRTLGASDNFKHRSCISIHDITEDFGSYVIDWFNKHLNEK